MSRSEQQPALRIRVLDPYRRAALVGVKTRYGRVLQHRVVPRVSAHS
jgi:hypothetical protein